MEHLPDRAYGLTRLASFAASQGKTVTLPGVGLDPDPSSNDGGPTSQPGTPKSGAATIPRSSTTWRSGSASTTWSTPATGITESSRLSASSNPNSFAAFVSDFGGSGLASRVRAHHHDDDHQALRHHDVDHVTPPHTTTTSSRRSTDDHQEHC